MVEIKCSYSVSFEDSKWSLIPDSLITEFEGKKFLKMKATSAAIIALLLNGPVPKNASLASAPQLVDPLSKRNQAASDASGPKDIFGDSSELKVQVAQTLRKKPVPPGDYVVTIDINGVPVNCAMLGSRPWQTDLTVEFEPSQLNAVFVFLKADIQELLTPKRSYKRKAKDDTSKEE